MLQRVADREEKNVDEKGWGGYRQELNDKEKYTKGEIKPESYATSKNLHRRGEDSRGAKKDTRQSLGDRGQDGPEDLSQTAGGAWQTRLLLTNEKGEAVEEAQIPREEGVNPPSSAPKGPRCQDVRTSGLEEETSKTTGQPGWRTKLNILSWDLFM